MAPPYAKAIDPVIDAVRTVRYAGARAMNRIWPGCTIDRRRPASGGLVVAVVAPDGMGKTTQVRRIRELFGWKFSCAAVYLGTGDGEGWRIRRLIRAAYIKRRSRVRASLLRDVGAADTSRSFKRRIGSLLLAVWGIIVALERYASIRRAQRMADRGFIVFCDRWPQDIQSGLMDGPTRPSGHGSPGRLRKWELSLYRRMAQSQPDVTVQLVGAYATSQARKPGEISREEFDKRMGLMAELRARFPETCVLDADRDVDAVSKSLFRLVWNAL
jgi:thymidylate kinase